MIYLDYAASCPLFPEVIEVLCQSTRDDFANPSAPHSLGKKLSQEVEKIADRLCCEFKAEQVIFVSSATEANNLIISHLANEKYSLYFHAADHPSIVESCQQFAADSHRLQGRQSDERTLEKKNAFILSHVMSSSGWWIHPTELAQQFCLPERPSHLHVDASQSFGKLALNWKEFEYDSLTLSSHKLGGPKGIAALILKKKTKLRPLMWGGGHQEGIRPSSMAFPLIKAFDKACQLASEHGMDAFNRAGEINKQLRERLLAIDHQVIFPLDLDECSPYILMFIVPGISSDILLRHLEERGVYLSTTSACSSKKVKVNPSFSALDIPQKFHSNVLRLSFGPSFTTKEMEDFVTIWEKVWNEIKFLIKGKRK